MLVCGIKALGRPAGVAVRLYRLGARRALRERRRGGARARRRGPGTCAPPPRLHPLVRRQHARSRSSTWHRARTPHAPGRTGAPSLVAASPPPVSAPACCTTRHYAAQPCAPRAHEVKLAACRAPCWDSPDRPCLAQSWSPLRCERGGGVAVWGRALRSTGARACCPSCPRCRWRRAGARAPHEGKPAPLAQAPARAAQARLDFGYLPGYIGFAAGYIGTETLSTVLLGILGLAASIKIHNKTLRAVRAAGLPAWRWAHGRSLGGVPAWQRAGRILQK